MIFLVFAPFLLNMIQILLDFSLQNMFLPGWVNFFLHEITHVFDSTAFRPSCLRNTTLTNTLLFSFYFLIYNVVVDLYPFVFLRNL